MKVLHIITCLARGGAETMLFKLVAALPRERGFEHHVISLIDGSDFDFAALGVQVRSLGLRRGLPTPQALLRLHRMIGEIAPDLIHAWMYHSNIAASLAAGSVPVLWNVHHALQNLAGEKRMTRWLIKGGAWAARWPRLIVYCSQLSLRQHEQLGYPAQKSRFIANGFDCDLFRPDPMAKPALRRMLGLPAEAQLVGHAARYHPIKHHAGLIAAFGQVAAQHPAAFLLLAGLDVDAGNAALAQAIAASGCAERIKLLGQVDDMPAFYAGIDVLALSSLSEGFPNVLGEAMACGTPCISTDVGDAAAIIGDTGCIVPVDDAAAFGRGLAALLAHPAAVREASASRARERIVDRFSIHSVAAQFAQSYRDVLALAR